METIELEPPGKQIYVDMDEVTKPAPARSVSRMQSMSRKITVKPSGSSRPLGKEEPAQDSLHPARLQLF